MGMIEQQLHNPTENTPSAPHGAFHATALLCPGPARWRRKRAVSRQARVHAGGLVSRRPRCASPPCRLTGSWSPSPSPPFAKRRTSDSPKCGSCPRRVARPHAITPAGVESSTPRWAPDGKRLVVTSAGKSDPRYHSDDFAATPEQVDRFQAGSMPHDGTFMVWSSAPDRTRAAAANDDPYAAMGQSRPPYGSITRPADPKRFDGRQIVDFPFRSNDQGYLPVRTGPREFNATQVFIQSFDGSPRRQLTSNELLASRGEAVSPDGKWIAFVADAVVAPGFGCRRRELIRWPCCLTTRSA